MFGSRSSEPCFAFVSELDLHPLRDKATFPSYKISTYIRHTHTNTHTSLFPGMPDDISDTSSSIHASASSISCTSLAIGYGPTVVLWDYSTQTSFTNFTPSHNNSSNRKQDDDLLVPGYLSDVVFSPNGQVIATSCYDSPNVILSQASTGAQLAKIEVPSIQQQQQQQQHYTPTVVGVTSLNFGGGGRYMSFSTCSTLTSEDAINSNNKVYVYNLAKMKWARSFSLDSEFYCGKVCFDPTNNFLAAISTKSSNNNNKGGGVNALTLWNVREGKVAASMYYPYSILPSQSSTNMEQQKKGAMGFSALVPHYCAVGCGSSVLLYDLHRTTTTSVKSTFLTVGSSSSSNKTSEPLLILPNKHNGFVTDVAFNPIARSLLASSSIADKCVKFHDIVTNKTIQTVYTGGDDSPTCLKFHSNGVTFAIGTFMGNVHVYDLRKMDSPSSSNDSDCHLNASIGKWNGASWEILPGARVVVPVSHVCFQEQLAPNKTKTSPRRPAGNTTTMNTINLMQDNSKLDKSSHDAVDASGDDDERSVVVKGEKSNFATESGTTIPKKKVDVGSNSVTTIVDVSSVGSQLSSSRKTLESAYDEVIHSDLTKSTSLGEFARPKKNNSLAVPAANEQTMLPISPSHRLSYNFDHVDASLDRIMRSIHLSPPPSSVVVVPEQDKKMESSSRIASAENNMGISSMMHPLSANKTQNDDEFNIMIRRERNNSNDDDNDNKINKLVLRQVIEDVTLDLRNELGQSIRNLHIDLLRQFQLQSDEISEALQQQNKVMMALVDENRNLRNENEWLRSQDGE